MAHGWYLTTSPIITSNWLAAPGQQWAVPIGGGFGRVFKVGGQCTDSRLLQRDPSDRDIRLAITGHARASVPSSLICAETTVFFTGYCGTGKEIPNRRHLM